MSGFLTTWMQVYNCDEGRVAVVIAEDKEARGVRSTMHRPKGDGDYNQVMALTDAEKDELENCEQKFRENVAAQMRDFTEKVAPKSTSKGGGE